MIAAVLDEWFSCLNAVSCFIKILLLIISDNYRSLHFEVLTKSLMKKQLCQGKVTICIITKCMHGIMIEQNFMAKKPNMGRRLFFSVIFISKNGQVRIAKYDLWH